jgi:type II secretory ATPase GspE/PulE/Tfp pilus assembly ATPase PilB-like protein
VPLGLSNSKTGQRLVSELVRLGKVDPKYGDALIKRYTYPAEIAQFLLSANKVSEEDLVKASAVAQGLNFIHIMGKNIDRDILSIIPESVARNFSVIAFEKVDKIIRVVAGRPYNLTENLQNALIAIEKSKGVKIDLLATTMRDINWALQAYSTPAAQPQSSPVVSDNIKVETAQPDKGNENEVNDSVKNKNFEFIDLSGKSISTDILLKFPLEIAQKYQMVVFQIVSENELKVAAVDPTNSKTQEIVDFIEKRNNIHIDLYQTNIEGYNFAIAQYSPNTTINQQTAQPEENDSVTEDHQSTQNEANKELPAGVSPEMGGKTAEGVTIIGSKEISTVQAGGSNINIATDDNLGERNLDAFLSSNITTTQELIDIVKSGFIPKIVAAILSLGVNLRASDIHLEPLRNNFRLRYRIDGDLNEYLYMPLSLFPPVISRIKILSDLKIDEQRIPQDGRYDAIANKHEFDVRVSSLPTVNGEKVVMRLLDKSGGIYTLEKLGFVGKTLTDLENELKRPWGVILATGPTGSGKSTTLYAILNKIATPKINVITLEDPVEYEIKGVNQVQVKPKIGFSFAEGLRSILRQDPNIIMVGEVRDGETAELATHAALTGHVVLTTLHTNDAAGALPRLINMGVEPYLITSAINAIIAQRLVRKLCQNCKQLTSIPETVLNQVKDIMKSVKEFNQEEEMKFYGAKGCDQCRTGFEGRIGIYEVLVMSDKIEEAAIDKKTTNEILEIAVKDGMITMQQDGIMKALQGLTTLDEVFKVTNQD